MDNKDFEVSRMPVINVENAQVKTASVEIKALTVSGKQITLSVFRQIEEENLLDKEDATINGLPWGKINYFWGKDKETVGLHILWQRDKQLKRFIMPDNGEKFIYHPLFEHDKSLRNEKESELSILKYRKEDIDAAVTRMSRDSYFFSHYANGKSLNREECLDYQRYLELKISKLIKEINELSSSIKDLNIIYKSSINKYQKHLIDFYDLPHLFIAI